LTSFRHLRRKAVSIALRVLLLGTEVALFLSPTNATAFTFVNLPIITNATDVVEEPTKEVYLGNTIQLTVKRTPAARNIRAHDFQIRMFRLPEYGSLPYYWEDLGSCYVYFSQSFKIKGERNADVINVAQLDDNAAYLSPSYDGTMSNGRYVLVFERSAVSDQIFRLHKDHVDSYFKSGIVVEIKPFRKYAPADVRKLKAQLDDRSDARFTEIHVNSPDRRCYKVTVQNDAEGTELATLAECSSSEI